ncbi:CsbD family protein [Adhaeretor mobilis]|uniref:CsbD-like domain-containing protein n=1 Tax=Adhaeretor mobilis TaxID=1930276 RepID=A0A517MX68_9BACT|nr:CsbD family protein [Adhaeretor mobilis]QDS99470.1 hypothetical protein HG15A2_27930 [Adhaeretor mobilis]
MATQQEIAGNWNQLKGMLREKWGQLTDDELQEAQGDYDQLVGLIQQKTGQGKAKVEKIVNELSDQCSGVLENAKVMAHEYLGQAGESVNEVAGQVRERMGDGYAEAENLVKRRPVESVAVAFGTGLIAGVIVGLVFRSR